MRAATRRVLKQVGRRVAELRRSRALTQERFAELLNVSVRYVQFVESGAENLTVETLMKLSAALRVPVVELFAPPPAPASRARTKRIAPAS